MKEKFIKWFFFRVLGVQWIRSCGSTLPGEEGSNKKREFGEVIRAMNEKNRAVFSMGMSGGIHRPN